MITDDLDLEELERNAVHYRALGVKPYMKADKFPFERATLMRPGGSHRLDMATSVYFEGNLDGLTIRTHFDIEDRAANGTGAYQIQVDSCRNVLKRLPMDVAEQFADYLLECSEKLTTKGDEYREVANRQYADAVRLRQAADAAGVTSDK